MSIPVEITSHAVFVHTLLVAEKSEGQNGYFHCMPPPAHPSYYPFLRVFYRLGSTPPLVLSYFWLMGRAAR